jgi:hypothetical protein
MKGMPHDLFKTAKPSRLSAARSPLDERGCRHIGGEGARKTPRPLLSASCLRRRRTLPFDDSGYGVLAQSDLAADQPVATSLFDQRENPRRQTVGLRSLPFLPIRRRESRPSSVVNWRALKLVSGAQLLSGQPRTGPRIGSAVNGRHEVSRKGFAEAAERSV